jgi:hypothetical protein
VNLRERRNWFLETLAEINKYKHKVAIQEWSVGGHSLGGHAAAAALFDKISLSDDYKISKLFMWGVYSLPGLNLLTASFNGSDSARECYAGRWLSISKRGDCGKEALSEASGACTVVGRLCERSAPDGGGSSEETVTGEPVLPSIAENEPGLVRPYQIPKTILGR